MPTRSANWATVSFRASISFMSILVERSSRRHRWCRRPATDGAPVPSEFALEAQHYLARPARHAVIIAGLNDLLIFVVVVEFVEQIGRRERRLPGAVGRLI